MPPVAVRSMEPVAEPLQSTLTWVSVKVMAVGWIKIMPTDLVQALASVMVTV